LGLENQGSLQTGLFVGSANPHGIAILLFHGKNVLAPILGIVKQNELYYNIDNATDVY
jgi:hypothetical protein